MAVKPAAVCEGKESKALIPESNPPSIWCPDPPPRVILVRRGRPCYLTEPTCLLPAAHQLRKAWAYDDAGEGEVLSPVHKSEHLEKKKRVICF